MALANEPRHRYQTAAGFRIDLERWLDGTRSPVAFLGSGLDNTLLRFTCFIRRHTRIWQVLLGVLIGILLTMAGTAMG